jgi:hypothetical protein
VLAALALPDFPRAAWTPTFIPTGTVSKEFGRIAAQRHWGGGS